MRDEHGLVRDKKGKFTKDCKPVNGFKKGNQLWKDIDFSSSTIYTEEVVLNETIKMFKEVKANEDIIYVKQLFNDKPYSNEQYNNLKRKFSDNELIPSIYKKIQDIIEGRLVSKSFNKEGDSRMGQFVLKNKYGWKDKSEHEHTGNVNISLLNLVDLRKKQLEEAEFIDLEAESDDKNDE